VITHLLPQLPPVLWWQFPPARLRPDAIQRAEKAEEKQQGEDNPTFHGSGQNSSGFDVIIVHRPHSGGHLEM